MPLFCMIFISSIAISQKIVVSSIASFWRMGTFHMALEAQYVFWEQKQPGQKITINNVIYHKNRKGTYPQEIALKIKHKRKISGNFLTQGGPSSDEASVVNVLLDQQRMWNLQEFQPQECCCHAPILLPAKVIVRGSFGQCVGLNP